MDINNEIWYGLYDKYMILDIINKLKNSLDDPDINIEINVLNEIYKILDDYNKYLENIDEVYINLSENELNYVINRINNTKSLLIKSFYIFYKFQYTKNNIDFYEVINYFNNSLDEILKNHTFEYEREKYLFISNILIPYLIFLHEYTIKNDTSKIKIFNKIIKNLLFSNILNKKDYILLINSLFNRPKLDKEFIRTILSKLEEPVDDNRKYIENLEICKYICKKWKNSSEEKKYDKLISDQYLKIAENSEGIKKSIFTKKAVEYDLSKEVIFQKNRDDINLNDITQNYSISWDIFMFFCVESFNFSKMIQRINQLTLHFKYNTGDPLIDDCTKVYFDENNNITNENDNPSLLETQLEIYMHNELIYHLLNYGHLYYKDIKKYLRMSWFDEEILKYIEYPLKIFFKNNKTDLEIKCAISILIPQFEKIFRKLAIEKEIIDNENNINELKMSNLIENEEIKEILPKNVHNYINYVFFKYNLGLKLRNKFFHSTSEHIFTETNLNILFVCLIKLSQNF